MSAAGPRGRPATWLAAAPLLAALGCAGAADAPRARPELAEQPEQAAREALAWLFARQDADGGLRSDHYGVLRPGCSLTATVLLAAALLPERLRAPHRAGIDRAFSFLAANTRGDGATGLGGDVLDYPTYTAAHWLHALVLLRPAGWQQARERLQARLCTVQLGPALGWQQEDAAFGAFGFGTDPEPAPLGAELINLPLQRAVLEALRASGLPAEHPVVGRARRYVHRCQRLPGPDDPHGDGGFFFTPTPAFQASKAGADVQGGRELPRTYGTTTCDGIRALLACGAAAPGGEDAARLAAARAWLVRHLLFESVPGLPREAEPPLEPAVRLYWYATLAPTLAALGIGNGWRERLFAALREHRRPDGSFVGLSDRMKEDDPLVATVLALFALGPLVR